MANELIVAGETTGAAVYAVVRRDADEHVWSTVAGDWVAYATADYADYAVALAETPAGSRYWQADRPVGSQTVAVNVFYYRRLGASPSVAADEIIGTEPLAADGAASAGDGATVGLVEVDDYKLVVETAASDERLQFLIDAASRAIENYCGGFTFVAEGRAEYLDGTGANYLQLGARPASLTAVTLDPESDDPQDVSVANFGWTAKGVLYVRPDAADGPAYFDAGVRNWLVEYTSYGVVPDDLRMACVLVVQALERMTDPDALVSEKTIGNRKVKYAAAYYIDLTSPMFSEARPLLAPYVVPFCL